MPKNKLQPLIVRFSPPVQWITYRIYILGFGQGNPLIPNRIALKSPKELTVKNNSTEHRFTDDLYQVIA